MSGGLYTPERLHLWEELPPGVKPFAPAEVHGLLKGATKDQRRVGDLQAARLMVPVSRKGSGEKQITHTAVQIGDDVLNVLRLAAAGRKGTDPLFVRPRWRRVPSGPGFGKLEVYERGAWTAASELTLVWKRIVKRAGLPPEIVPYALRRSSIVRGRRKGLPTQMVAKLHDTSGGMIESHYGRFIADALNELARSAVVPLMPVPVTPIRVVERG